MYRIKEDKSGYFTIYEVKEVTSFFGKKKIIEERMSISDLFDGKWYINGVFKSEKECKKYLKLLKEYNERELTNKTVVL